MAKKLIDFNFVGKRKHLNEAMASAWEIMIDVFNRRSRNFMVSTMNENTLIPDCLPRSVGIYDERGLFQYNLRVMREIEHAFETDGNWRDVYNRVSKHMEEMGERYRVNEGKPARTVRKL